MQIIKAYYRYLDDHCIIKHCFYVFIYATINCMKYQNIYMEKCLNLKASIVHIINEDVISANFNFILNTVFLM